MSSPKTVRSVKSTQSMKSLKSSRDARKGYDVQSFENMLDFACKKFQCPYTIVVEKGTDYDEFYKTLMKQNVQSKKKNFITQEVKKSSKDPSSLPSVSSYTNCDSSSNLINSIIVTMLYDKFNSLTELVITKRKDIPRILLKIIRVLAPHYQSLTKITISKSKIDMYTIYELSKILKESTINSICLDGSSMPMGDFTMLLNTTKLTSLSLCRCTINDKDCELIASKLHDSAPADNLLLLNLSSNRITDVGAKCIADALRTNRHLRYLNLTDNHIEDIGAGYILDILMEFPLTYDEIIGMKQRRINYFKSRNDLYFKYLEECEFDEISNISRLSTSRKKRKMITKKEDILDGESYEEYLKIKAEIMTNNILGKFRDPFQPNAVKYEDKYYYCLGNVSLQYLNLSYNSLSYISIKKLCNVIRCQSLRKLENRGLTKVVVDGNNLPISCVEFEIIKDILDSKIMQYGGRVSELVRRKGRLLKIEDE